MKGMEVEIKLRLPDKQAYEKVADLFAKGFVTTHEQENFFFDGTNSELESQRAVLRVRFYDVDKKAILTLKGKTVIVEGVGRSSETEEAVDPAVARTFLEHPNALLDVSSDLVSYVKTNFGVSNLKCLGGFRNIRNVYNWESFTIELDETLYDWGTLHEIELETDQPEAVKTKLEALLTSNGIMYQYSTATKFKNFVNKTLI